MFNKQLFTPPPQKKKKGRKTTNLGFDPEKIGRAKKDLAHKN